ncbi:MAG: NAD-dependent epimerase/dehydratase family protein, partial [Acidimicrobiales bacterium]
MSVFVVTGAAGRLGHRVISRFLQVAETPSATSSERDKSEATRSVTDIVALDQRGGRGVDKVDLALSDLTEHLANCSTVVHLASAFDGQRSALQSGEIDVAATTRLLEAAAEANVERFVLLSSAMVYGAWPNNPVPLTEAAPVRPNAGLVFAKTKAKLEEQVIAWGIEHDVEVVVLRPTIAVAPNVSSWVADAIRSASAIGVDGEEPPLQFLHLDDLAEAIVLAGLSRFNGIFNVAPDGWAEAAVVRSLEGSPPRLQVSEEIAGKFASFRWRYRLAPTPPGLVPYTMYPWVVANDQLKAHGWEPRRTTEQTVVESIRPKPWAMVSSRKRQQIALGGAAAVLATGAGIAGTLLA